MREIKFRAFDTKNKEWLTQVPCLEYLLDDPDAPASHHDVDSEDSLYFHPQSPMGPTFNGRIVYQQYTGVTDCKDMPIYEGDIVWLNSAHSSESWEKENNRFEIIFHRGAFQLKPIKLSKPQGNGVGGGNQQFSHIVEIVGHDKDDSPIYKYLLPPPRPLSSFGICEVMGNVFENPELLT